MNRRIVIQLITLCLFIHIPMCAASNPDPTPVPPPLPVTTILYEFYADYSVEPHGDMYPLIYRPVGFSGISPTNKNQSTYVYGSNFTVEISHFLSHPTLVDEQGTLHTPLLIEPQPQDQLFHIKNAEKNAFITITPPNVSFSNTEEITVLDGLDIEGFVADTSYLHTFANTSQQGVSITEMADIYDVYIALGSLEFPYTIHNQYTIADGFLNSMEFYAKWQNDDSWTSLNCTINLLHEPITQQPTIIIGVIPFDITSVVICMISVTLFTKLIRRHQQNLI